MIIKYIIAIILIASYFMCLMRFGYLKLKNEEKIFKKQNR